MCIIIIVSKQNKKKVNIPSSGGNHTVQCVGVCWMWLVVSSPSFVQIVGVHSRVVNKIRKC